MAKAAAGCGRRFASVALAVVLASILTPAVTVKADPALENLVRASLVPELTAVEPGGTVWVGLRLEMKPGWHTYWRNPGESGLSTTVDWTLPPGVVAGPLSWPQPERFTISTITNYGYAGTVMLLTPIEVPAEFRGDRLAIRAEASWLVCAEVCVPGSATLATDLPTGTPSIDPAAASFVEARSAIPPPARFETTVSMGRDRLALTLPAAAMAGLVRPTARFLPLDPGIIDDGAEQSLAMDGDRLVLTLRRSSPGQGGTAAAVQGTLDGVVVITGSPGDGAPNPPAPQSVSRAFAISANPVAAPDDEAALTPLVALALALLGGMLLNVMPCVFPILSLKLLGLVRQSGESRSVRLGHSAAYASGILVSFTALGLALLALRAGGQEIGWGFQLQSPVFVAGLAYLLFAMGLWLSGVLEAGGAFIGWGSGLAARSGLAGSFFTGLLAALVATPCTAPFMGAALGFAIAAPPVLGLGVFLALGIGLALPYCVISVLPGLARILPRPGRWMETVKQALAFPLYATVAWLIWVLSRQTAASGLGAALLGLVLIGFAGWCLGRAAASGPQGRLIGRAAGAVAIASALALLLPISTDRSGQARLDQTDGPATGAGLAYEPFSSQRLAALRASGRPVFIDMTAAWCITCLVNERTTLDSAAVRDAFAQRGIVALKGDWTNQNPEITRLLQQFGRNGVPLYVFYEAGKAPIVLPQILTEATLLQVIGRGVAGAAL
jgi:thiol:disulfide interchange protein DsbD